jgi:hypothetical protein
MKCMFAIVVFMDFFTKCVNGQFQFHGGGGEVWHPVMGVCSTDAHYWDSGNTWHTS